MTRDEAIRVAAGATVDFNNNETWASAVVSRADALLAAIGEPEELAEQGECCAAQARITEAATEARVVRELAEHFDSIDWLASARIVRCGDWRAKGAGRE